MRTHEKFRRVRARRHLHTVISGFDVAGRDPVVRQGAPDKERANTRR